VIRFVAPERADPKLMLELMEKGPKAGLKIAVSQIRNVFALREPEEGEEVLTPPALSQVQAPADQPPAFDPATQRQAAARENGPAPRDSIDALVDELIQSGDMQEAAEGELGQLIEAIGHATTFEEVQDILAVFTEGAPGALRDLLDRSTFAARVAGEVGAPVR